MLSLPAGLIYILADKYRTWSEKSKTLASILFPTLIMVAVSIGQEFDGRTNSHFSVEDWLVIAGILGAISIVFSFIGWAVAKFLISRILK